MKRISYIAIAAFISPLAATLLAVLDLSLQEFVNQFWFDIDILDEIACGLPWYLPFYLFLISPVVFVATVLALNISHRSSHTHRILAGTLFIALLIVSLLFVFQGPCTLLYRLASAILLFSGVYLLRPFRFLFGEEAGFPSRPFSILFIILIIVVILLFLIAPNIEHCIKGKCFGTL